MIIALQRWLTLLCAANPEALEEMKRSGEAEGAAEQAAVEQVIDLWESLQEGTATPGSAGEGLKPHSLQPCSTP